MGQWLARKMQNALLLGPWKQTQTIRHDIYINSARTWLVGNDQVRLTESVHAKYMSDRGRRVKWIKCPQRLPDKAGAETRVVQQYACAVLNCLIKTLDLYWLVFVLAVASNAMWMQASLKTLVQYTWVAQVRNLPIALGDG